MINWSTVSSHICPYPLEKTKKWAQPTPHLKTWPTLMGKSSPQNRLSSPSTEILRPKWLHVAKTSPDVVQWIVTNNTQSRKHNFYDCTRSADTWRKPQQQDISITDAGKKCSTEKHKDCLGVEVTYLWLVLKWFHRLPHMCYSRHKPLRASATYICLHHN